ncbi:hypothetical protein KY346_06050 [Candidatus Woesearchaeota archaeon]|nr:hypothetical protein [Candidatus Woesearchaeota archaeon]
METPKIVPQRQFASLDDFIEGNNNFYARLVVDSANSYVKPERVHLWPCYTRFAQIAPELALELKQVMTMQNYGRATQGEPWKEVFPWDKVWEAYKIMSTLVYLGDPYVEGIDDFSFLIR